VKMKKPKLTILPGQCRAARGLIGINQAQLANLASISRTTVIEFETSKRVPGADFVQAIQRALEAAGVAFTNGGEPGVKLRRPE
jgi:transcriptional regulator with XRE-family HTH domain